MNKEDFAAGYVKGVKYGSELIFNNLSDEAGKHSIPKGTNLWLLLNSVCWKGREDEKTESSSPS